MRFQFGDVTLDEASRLVRRAGETVHLSPKAFDLLLALIRERPRVLSKEDLHARIWPDTFVSDTSLAMLVAEVRAALGESARDGRTIRTVHRHGYACQAEVQAYPESPDTPGAPSPGRERGIPCWLLASAGPVPLFPGDNTVGREPGTTVWLDSPSVSRRHARILVGHDRVLVEDLGSKNGTFVRGVRIDQPTPIEDGDELRFGSVTATFRSRAEFPTMTEGGS